MSELTLLVTYTAKPGMRETFLRCLAARGIPEMIRAAGIMVMVIPMVCIYPFLQKYFVKGVMIGSVKG